MSTAVNHGMRHPTERAVYVASLTLVLAFTSLGVGSACRARRLPKPGAAAAM